MLQAGWREEEGRDAELHSLIILEALEKIPALYVLTKHLLYGIDYMLLGEKLIKTVERFLAHMEARRAFNYPPGREVSSRLSFVFSIPLVGTNNGRCYFCCSGGRLCLFALPYASS